MRVGIVGINHKLADLKLREKLAKACQKRFGPLHAIQGDHFFILLSTCNRTEVYFSSADLAATHTYLLGILRNEVEEEFDHKLYSYFGEDCFCHLTRVASGLDSAIIAETEIQGQVKIAYELACEYHAMPTELHYLFQKALGIAKKVRSDLQLGRGMPNIEHAIFQTGKQIFKTPEKVRLLFVGASDINEKILRFLKVKNFQEIAICNRSNEQACEWSRTYHIPFLPWSQLSSWHDFDWIIVGTKSSEFLINRQHISQQSIGKKMIMDLCVPRNVDPKLGQDSRITLLNIDQINCLLKTRHRNMTHSLAEAEHRIAEATHQHTNRYNKKAQIKVSFLAATA